MALHTRHRRAKGQPVHPIPLIITNPIQVLLPPGTAAMYEQLLKFEAFELAKKSSLSPERVLQIRHLKDRMVRKCIKLAKSSPPPGTSTSHTIIAPPDFRLKEMEKWFKEQQKRTNALLHPQPTHCPQCIASRRPNRNPPPKSSGVTPPTAKPKITPKVAIPSSSRRSVSSPPPLPHLRRLSNPTTGFDLSIDPQKISPLPQTPPPPRQQLTRRRSCIKRASTGDFTKTVSWADNRDLTEHLSKYASLARQAHLSGQRNLSYPSSPPSHPILSRSQNGGHTRHISRSDEWPRGSSSTGRTMHGALAFRNRPSKTRRRNHTPSEGNPPYHL